MLKMIDDVVGALANLLMAVAGVALVLMMVQVFADVAGKYFLNAPIPLTIELVEFYYMTSVVFLPLALVERKDGHINVELIYTSLNRVGKRLLEILGFVFGIWFYWMMTARTLKVALDKYEVGEFSLGSFSIITWPSRFVLPIGASLITVVLVLKLIRTVSALIDIDKDPWHGAPPSSDLHDLMKKEQV